MNIAGLAYVVIRATRPEAWRRFGEDVVGMQAQDVPGGLALRLDDRAGRFFIEQGSEDIYFASGWEVRTEADFAAALMQLDAAGLAYSAATPQECALRHVFDMVWFRDPSGNRHELALGFVSNFDRFRSPAGVPGFVTGDLGLGHMVLPAPEIEATRRFLENMMGFGLSDILIHRPLGPGGPEQRIYFMHCRNGRHHSLALFEGDVPSGCVHLMVEVPTMDEVGRAYDRMLAHQVPLMATLGKHSNDHMTSFYMATPGGFALEYGYGGRVIDWDQHTIFESTSVSLWGHDFSVGFGAAAEAQLADAA
ncbi:MAG: VOC family protein [Chakrabartia sp.]